MQKVKQTLRAVLLSSMVAWGCALAEGDPERGEILADTCMGCHGIPGYRNAYPSYRVPKLGGQHTEYLVLAMQGYRSGNRQHPTMRAQGASLTDQDMLDIAVYFGSQGESEGAVGQEPDREPPQSAATCVACHGENGISPAATWPSLAGQHRDYLVQSMLQYRNQQRDDAVMAGQVMALTDEDIEELSAFYASQPGLFTASYDD